MTQQVHGGSTVREDQIELTVEAALVTGDGLSIRYAVANRADEAVVLLNFVQRPVQEPEQSPDRCYVEAGSDDTVVITQRALVEAEPASKRPLHRTTPLDPGNVLERALSVPLQHANPERPVPARDLPEPVQRVQLCLAFVPAASFSAEELGLIREQPGELRRISTDVVARQQLVRSQVVDLG